MLPVFDTDSGLPLPMINLEKRTGIPNEDMPTLVSTAEVATLQLEFRYLSQLTSDNSYWRKVENVGPVSSVYHLMNPTSFTVIGDAHHESSPTAPWPGIYVYAVRFARQSLQAQVFTHIHISCLVSMRANLLCPPFAWVLAVIHIMNIYCKDLFPEPHNFVLTLLFS